MFYPVTTEQNYDSSPVHNVTPDKDVSADLPHFQASQLEGGEEKAEWWGEKARRGGNGREKGEGGIGGAKNRLQLVFVKSIFTSILQVSGKFIEKCRWSKLFGE